MRPSVNSSTSPQKPGRTGQSDFSATTRWAPTTASLHTGTEGAGGQAGDGVRWGARPRGGAVSGEGWCPTHASAASPVSAGTTPRAGAAHGPCLGHVWGQPDPSAFGRVLLTSPLSFISDYVIDDKVAVLQKRDHEGFGFVLRGAKGNDEGGVPLARVSLERGLCPSACLLPGPCPPSTARSLPVSLP